MQDLLFAALQYAELGYAVFPCANNVNPAPLTAHGFKDATTDEEQIERWWTTYPDACIGLAAEGLLVVDVDAPPNPWLADEPDLARQLLATPTALTPSGGRHHVFRRPAGKAWSCTVGRLAPHVDTRTDGGYFVVPPSKRPDGRYRWLDGCELDVPPDQLPEPPEWLIQRLDQLATQTHTSPPVATNETGSNPIPSGQRNVTLARLAGTMRRAGMSQEEISAAIGVTNAQRCVPPLSDREVQRIAASIARYEPDQISVALIENHWDQVFGDEPFRFATMSSRELDEGDFALSYLIEGVLVQGQPGVLAGPKKTLKTNISIDLALSLAEAGLFLGRFNVPKAVRVGVMSGESGAATIQETARRIADAKFRKLQDYDNVVWSFDVPQLDLQPHIEALQALVSENELDVLILDPTYLMMVGIGSDAGNLFIVGRLLKALGDLAQQTGCTPLLCHHLKKSVAEPYEPPELENIAWAGFQEFVRQWILLNRRVKYDPDNGGHHELWMSVGGSAGHSGLWGLNIDEGTRQDAGGRRWEVEVIGAAEAYEQRLEAQSREMEQRRSWQKENKRQKQRKAVLDALSKYPEGETSRVLRDHANVSGAVINEQLDELIDEGIVEVCEVLKNTRYERAYRLRSGGGTRGTVPPVPAEGAGGGTGLYI